MSQLPRITRIAVAAAAVTAAAGCPRSPEAPPATLVRYDVEPAGANCRIGGTAVRSGPDANDDGTLQDAEIAATRYVCAPELYATRWAASSYPAIETGRAVGWTPAGRRAAIYKTSATSRLKVTVFDGLRVGDGQAQAEGTYEVRLDGAAFGCAAWAYAASQGAPNQSAPTQNHAVPFGNVCLTDVLPPGAYELEAWMNGTQGPIRVGEGTGGRALVLVEELESGYAFSTEGGEAVQDVARSWKRAPGRTVTYVKRSPTTLLKITLADTLRPAYHVARGWGGVLVRRGPDDTPCSFFQVDAAGPASGEVGGDYHSPFVMTCVLEDVAAGPHELSVWFGAEYASSATLVGRNHAPLLLVEELERAGVSFAAVPAASADSGDLASDAATPWQPVPLRTVTHEVSAAGRTLKVTFSDSFRSARDVNDAWGHLQLFVDGAPSGCLAGQHFANPTFTTQDHHRPVNQVCLVRDLSPGAHTFDIRTSTQHGNAAPSGTNKLGWKRGQSLLLVEELP